MNCAIWADAVRDKLPSLFSCTALDDQLVISTPFRYPDGDVLEVSVLPGRDTGVYVVTDFGDAMSYLAGHGVFVDAGSRRQMLLENYLSGVGASLHRDAVYTVVESPLELADKVLSLGQCLIRILDLAHTTVVPVPVSFFDEVVEHVTRLNVQFVRKAKMRALLGPKYPAPDFGVAKGSHLTAVKTLSATTDSRAQPQIAQTVRTFAAVKRIRPTWERLTILDDTIDDLWQPEWIEEVSSFSTVLRWKEDREQIDEILTVTA